MIATLGVAIVIRTSWPLAGNVTAFAAELVRSRQLARQLPVLPGRRPADQHRFLGVHDAVISAQRVVIIVVTAIVGGGHHVALLPHELRPSGPRHRRRPRDGAAVRREGHPACRCCPSASPRCWPASPGLHDRSARQLRPHRRLLVHAARLRRRGPRRVREHRRRRRSAALLIGLTEELFGGLMLPKLVEQLGGDPANVLQVPVGVPVRADARGHRDQAARAVRADGEPAVSSPRPHPTSHATARAARACRRARRDARLPVPVAR